MEAETDVRVIMKVIVIAVALFLLFFSRWRSLAQAAAEPQVFSTSAGPVKITPLYHASTLIEAGGKTIYLIPPSLRNFRGFRRLISF